MAFVPPTPGIDEGVGVIGHENVGRGPYPRLRSQIRQFLALAAKRDQ